MDNFWKWFEQQEGQQMCKQVCDCTRKGGWTPHKHDACIRAWLDGKPVEVRMANGDWKLVVQTHLPSFDTGWEYRIKPEPATDLETYGVEKGDLWRTGGGGLRIMGSTSKYDIYGSRISGTLHTLLFRRGVVDRLREV